MSHLPDFQGVAGTWQSAEARVLTSILSDDDSGALGTAASRKGGLCVLLDQTLCLKMGFQTVPAEMSARMFLSCSLCIGEMSI